MFVDSHCHLSFPELRAALPDIRAAMAAAQVDRALCICTTLEEFESVHALAMSHDNFWCTAGVHPDNEGVLEPRLEDLLALAARPKVVGLGDAANIANRPSLHPELVVLGYQSRIVASQATHHYVRDFEGAVRRGQDVVRAAIQIREKGFVPDVVVAHPGWDRGPAVCSRQPPFCACLEGCAFRPFRPLLPAVRLAF